MEISVCGKDSIPLNFSLKSANKVTGKNLVLGDLSSSYYNKSFENEFVHCLLIKTGLKRLSS